MPATLEDARARVEVHAAEHRERSQRPAPPRPGRPQTPRTRERISNALAEHRRNIALSAPVLHPLRVARLQRELTIDQLADLALVDATTVQRIETFAQPEPSPLTVKRLGRALDVEPDSLTA